jgi:hypothetical protein
VRHAPLALRLVPFLVVVACAPEPPPPAAPAIVWPPEPVFQAVPAEEVAARALAVAFPTVREAVLAEMPQQVKSRAYLDETFGALRPRTGENRLLNYEYRWHREAEAATWAALAPLASVTELCAQLPGVVRCEVPSDSMGGGECLAFLAPSRARVYGIAAIQDEEARTVVSIAAQVTDVDRCTSVLSYSLVILDSARDRALWRATKEVSFWREASAADKLVDRCFLCAAVVPAENRIP